MYCMLLCHWIQGATIKLNKDGFVEVSRILHRSLADRSGKEQLNAIMIYSKHVQRSDILGECYKVIVLLSPTCRNIACW